MSAMPTPQEAGQARWLSGFVDAVRGGIDLTHEYRMLDPDYAARHNAAEQGWIDTTGTGPVRSEGQASDPVFGASTSTVLTYSVLGLGALLAAALILKGIK